MPTYGSQTISNSPLQSITSGAAQGAVVWNAETKAGLTSPPANAPYSLAVAISMPPNGTMKRISVELAFSADPGTLAVEVQTADTDSDAYYSSEDFGGASPGQVTAVNAKFTARIELGVDARFVRLKMTTLTNTVTVTGTIYQQ